MRLPFNIIFEAFEWIDREGGIFRRDGVEYRRIDCPRCDGNGGEEQPGDCFKCGGTGIVDIPQIEGIGNRTMDEYDPWEGEGHYVEFSDYSQYGGDNGRCDDDYQDESQAITPADIPLKQSPPPSNDDDIPF
jgi:hypothetical protein